ncbi:MAG: hypothetical protein J0L55_13305 [Caulobacterales bacterium]|nr:hypothetical protein [Caulobacterales bacterium]
MYAKRPNDNKELLAFLAKHLLVGVVIGWSILGIFIIFDVASLRTLIANNHIEFLVYPLLLVFFAITFGSVGMGIGIMGVNENDDDDDKKGGKREKNSAKHVVLAPVKVNSNYR